MHVAAVVLIVNKQANRLTIQQDVGHQQSIVIIDVDSPLMSRVRGAVNHIERSRTELIRFRDIRGRTQIQFVLQRLRVVLRQEYNDHYV